MNLAVNGTRAAIVMLCLFACGPASAAPLTGLEPNRVRVEYLPPKNPAHQYIHDRLKERAVLERLADFLSPIRLPRELVLKLEGCDGTVNAFYGEGIASVCYEYIDYVFTLILSAPRPAGLPPLDAVIGPTVDVFLHEAGHGAFDLLEVPVFGREEDAADQFAAYLQLQFGREEARTLVLGNAYVGEREAKEMMAKSQTLKDYANEHGLPAQRYFNTLCLAYGYDPELFADAMTLWNLPPERAEYCAAEYKQLARAFEKLIHPYVDAERLAAVKTKKKLRIEVLR